MDADFEDWARSTTPRLLRAAFLLTGDQHAAEDLVQQALIRVVPAWRRVEAPDAYVRQVMYRLEVARWRRRRVREVVVELMPDLGDAAEASHIETQIVVHTALLRLTPSQRAVLVLRFFEDLSEAETAKVLGRSIGTVKSQTHKALAALRAGAPELAELVGRRLPADA